MVSIRSHLAKGHVKSLLQALRFLNLNLNLNPNLFPQSESKSKSKITIKIRVKSLLRVLRFLNLNPNLNLSPLSESKIMITRKSLVSWTVAVLCLAASVARGADERDAQFDRWFAVQTNLQSWSADFTQTRSLKMLSQPLVATGKVWVTVPNRFRWELGQPAQTIVLRQ